MAGDAGISDASAMAEAIDLGERGRLSAPPNPWVGCVIVHDGEVVGRGFHERPGKAHAEAAALADAGEAAREATAYVSLAPCDHQGRTPPCSLALVDAGVARVVVAVDDPDPVSGDGLARLRQAGIEVTTGVGETAASESLRAFLHHRRSGRPWCVLKSATSIDGRTAAADGSSKWITGESARAEAHRLRAESQAVIVGSGTALADEPALTVRVGDQPPQPPLRVLLDARGRVRPAGPLFDPDLAPTLVITTAAAPAEGVAAWKEAGVEVAEVGAGRHGGVDLEAALGLLGRRGVLQALVEGGASLHGALVREGWADEVVVYVGGAVLGDQGRPLMADLEVASIEDAPRWVLSDVQAVGGDARLTWRPRGAS